MFTILFDQTNQTQLMAIERAVKSAAESGERVLECVDRALEALGVHSDAAAYAYAMGFISGTQNGMRQAKEIQKKRLHQ